MKLEQAVILAGGKGERLRPLTDHLPKPMVPVLDKPFLDYLIGSMVAVGIKRVLLLVGYRGEKIIEYYKNFRHPRCEIDFSVGAVEDQTGRRLLNAYDKLEKNFLLAYGDNYWPIDIAGMTRLYEEKGAKVSATVFSNKNGTSEYGPENNVEVGPDHFIKRYDKTRKSRDMNGVDIGYFIVDKGILDPESKSNASFEENVLPPLIAQSNLIGYLTDRQYYYITNVPSLKNFEAFVAAENVSSLIPGH